MLPKETIRDRQNIGVPKTAVGGIGPDGDLATLQLTPNGAMPVAIDEDGTATAPLLRRLVVEVCKLRLGMIRAGTCKDVSMNDVLSALKGS